MARNFKTWDKRTSALAHAAKARKRIENPIERGARPEQGLLLHTIQVESHVSGLGFELKIKQARRLNQVVVDTFGRSSKPHGIDFFMAHLRKKLVTRWMKI